MGEQQKQLKTNENNTKKTEQPTQKISNVTKLNLTTSKHKNLVKTQKTQKNQ